jgi:hypothetical protein
MLLLLVLLLVFEATAARKSGQVQLETILASYRQVMQKYCHEGQLDSLVSTVPARATTNSKFGLLSDRDETALLTLSSL